MNMENRSPNIVLIMADQLAPHFTGTYGHPVVKTPHMDRLAERGARFDAAYCNSPLCASSRASFMTGQFVTRIGAYDNASEFSSSIPTFAHYLRLMGYTTSLSGRMHFVGPDQLHGFEERLTTDIYPADYAWTPDWNNHEERVDRWYHNMDSVTEAGHAATTYQLDYDDEVAFFAKRKIFDYARAQVSSDPSRPFCLVASFFHPHDPYVARHSWWKLYDSAEIDLPKIQRAYAEQDPHSKRLMDGIEANTVGASQEEIRKARHAYYANTSYFDDMVGQIVSTLKQAQLLENTIIIVTSDHGDMLGERGLWYKMNFFEHSARVPLIMAGPGIRQGTIPNVCSLVDLLPTMLDMAGLGGAEKPELDQSIDGHSLFPLAAGGTDDFDEAIGEYCAEMTSYPVYMIRRGRYKYIHCDTDFPLLFDLESDPDELRNLADRAELAEIVQQFADEIHDRWDSERIRQDVVASQRQRRTVHAASELGKRTSWDYNPPRDASEEYVRNHLDWKVVATTTRIPPFS